MIEMTGLQIEQKKKIAALSKGYRQRVGLAQALIHDPKVLILDEPTAGLDTIASEILKEKIIAEKEKGKLVLITSHILSELDDLVSRIIYMQDGKLVFHKSIEAVREETGEAKLSKSIARVMSKQSMVE